MPWFSTVFGRDGIITALEYLWINPQLARGVLGFPGRHAGSDVHSPNQDAEPGKILHEMRRGEMAALGEIPFGQYYGTRRRDAAVRDAGQRLLPPHGGPGIHRVDLAQASNAACDWIESYGDSDGDGFCDYVRKSPKGLAHAGLERLVSIRCFMPTERWPTGRLRCAKCKATSTPPGGPRLSWPWRWALHGTGRALSPTTPTGCRRSSRRHSGARSFPRMRWRSMVTSAPAACARRTQATACSRALPAR